MGPKQAIIIGAGPAGLTAAYQLLDKTDIKPIVYEASNQIGGLSTTYTFKGNRIDVGGHRFFSKSPLVMEWWKNILPLQGAPARDDTLMNQKVSLSAESRIRDLGSKNFRILPSPDPEKEDRAMLVRTRISRIFFAQKLLEYPIRLNANLVNSLGWLNLMAIGCSYVWAQMFPKDPEKSLEDFFINRFGARLYDTFFKDYTEKVWGIPCCEINPQWGTQRIKGLSVIKTIVHAIKGVLVPDSSIEQSKAETSLIERFLYPKFGPGQIWNEVASQIRKHSGEIHLNHKVVGIENGPENISGVRVRNGNDGSMLYRSADYFLSSMPIKYLVSSMTHPIPQKMQDIAKGLVYRDFITVGILVQKVKLTNQTKTNTVGGLIPDNWIYVQDKKVLLGRIQIFNNWSPYLVQDSTKVWLGLEYFCNEHDELWNMPDKEMIDFAVRELVSIDFIDEHDFVDGTVLRVEKTYPAYSGTYEQFDCLKNYLDQYENLFLIGRNGMHRYNNMDHSMLTAIRAVENIISGITTKENIWAVNAEDEYHEEM